MNPRLSRPAAALALSLSTLVRSTIAADLGAAAMPQSAARQQLVEQAVATVFERFGDTPRRLLTNQLAVTLLDLGDPGGGVPPTRASYRGDVPIYPASVIKLFYLAAAHRWLEDGRLKETPELQRALRDMIVDSSNDATHYVVDLLTGTTSGPELSEADLAVWFEKRNVVSRHFASLGYRNVVANKKPWCEGPYGRESQSIRSQKPSRNMLSTDDTARLLMEIATGQSVTAPRSAAMLDLMKRDPGKPLEGDGEASQANAFTGLALRDVPGARLWSKAGWTSQVRHDAAYVELPNGARFVLVTFTEGHSKERGIIESIARTIVNGLGR